MSKENKKRVRESHPVEYNRGYMGGLRTIRLMLSLFLYLMRTGAKWKT